MVGTEAMVSFYRDILWALGEWMLRPTSTVQGCPRIVKRVALEHGLPVENIVLPRLGRAAFEERQWATREAFPGVRDAAPE